jgi:Ca2+-binding EF-hand superfamily protein
LTKVRFVFDHPYAQRRNPVLLPPFLDNDGRIQAKELGAVLASLGDSSDKVLVDVYKHFDFDLDGMISFEEFQNVMAYKLSKSDTEDVSKTELLEAFRVNDCPHVTKRMPYLICLVSKVFDVNGDGKISTAELTEVMRKLG